MLTARLTKIIDYQAPKQDTFKMLESATGINARIWSNVYNGRTKVNADHIEAIALLWPKYAYWLVTGTADPAAGHTSPELEQLEELKRAIGEK